jgi:hypothetical protein
MSPMPDGTAEAVPFVLSSPQPTKPVRFASLLYGLNNPHGALTAHRHLNGNRFQLRQVIQIMACDGFNEYAERHFPALRM